MAAFLYRCPDTGMNAQGWVVDDPRPRQDSDYETMTCRACRRVHMVNPKTGKAVGQNDE